MRSSSKISENTRVRKAGTIGQVPTFGSDYGNFCSQTSQSFVKPSTVAGMVESIIGCKWSLSVLQMVHQGINRPGAMERATMV